MDHRPLLLAIVMALLGATGCADNRMSLEAYAICGMPDTCSFSGKCDAYALGAIGYSPAADPDGDGRRSWLSFGVELRNQTPNNEDLEVARVNSNDAHVTGIRLEIEGPTSGTIGLDVGHQAVPANGTAVVWTYVLPPSNVTALASGTYVVNVVYLGRFDNGREFETPGFPIAVEVDSADTLGYGCTGTNVITCGSDQQTLLACGAP